MMQGASYRAALHLDVCYQRAGGGVVQRFNRRFGLLPIMVKSQVCYLENMNRSAPQVSTFSAHFLSSLSRRKYIIRADMKSSYKMCPTHNDVVGPYFAYPWYARSGAALVFWTQVFRCKMPCHA